MPRTIRSMRGKEKLVLISVHIPKKLLEELEDLVVKGYFPSRSEAIRTAIQRLVTEIKLRAYSPYLSEEELRYREYLTPGIR